MRRLLIVGCGDVVRRALPQLVRRWRVLALVREADADLRALGVVQIRGDLDDGATLKRLAGLADAVLHSAPPSAEGTTDLRTRRLIAALRQGRSLPRSLVYISTSGVYGDCRGERVTETRRVQPRTARGRRRDDAERQLRSFGRASACRVAILRAPGIYAADRLPIARLQRREPVLCAADDVFTNHIHADDLALLACAALRYGRANRCYNASDDSALRMGDYFDLVADRLGLPRAPRVPREQAREKLSALQMSFMNESRRLDNRRIKRELHARLRYPLISDGLAASSTERTA